MLRNPYRSGQLCMVLVCSQEHCGFSGKVLCLTEVVGLVVVAVVIVVSSKYFNRKQE